MQIIGLINGLVNFCIYWLLRLQFDPDPPLVMIADSFVVSALDDCVFV